MLVPRFEKPTVSVNSVQYLGGNLRQQNFSVKLTVQNPNDRSLPVSGLHAELSVAGERLASGVSDQPFVVPAHGTADFDMTIQANFALALLKLGQKRADAHGDAIAYDLTGAAKLDLPLLHEVPFHQTGSLALK